MPRNKPKIKRSTQGKELRVSKNAQFTVRQKPDGTQVIGGLAVVWAPATSEDLGGFVEQIDSHALDICLASKPDVRALWNHSADHPLARTKAGTLRLRKTNAGLFYELDASESQATKDLVIALKRGDVDQSSWGFICIRDKWEERADGSILRTVLEAEIFDVSPCTFPAYPDATSGVLRSRVSTATAPASLRSKLKRDDEDDPDSDESGESEDEPNENGCTCGCPECVGDDCGNCSDVDCDDPDCLCENAERSAHLDLLMRRLRA